MMGIPTFILFLLLSIFITSIGLSFLIMLVYEMRSNRKGFIYNYVGAMSAVCTTAVGIGLMVIATGQGV